MVPPSDCKIKSPKCELTLIKINLKRHIERKHSQNCSDCRLSFPTEDALRVHALNSHAKSGPFVCIICGNGFLSFYRLQSHKREEHRRIRKHYNAKHVDLTEFQSNSSLLQKMESVKHFLRDEKMELQQKVEYNFRINGTDTKFIRDKLDAKFDEMSCTVKLNIAFGFDLKSIMDNDSFKYYYAADNNTVFLNPVLISQQSDLDAQKGKPRKYRLARERYLSSS